MTSGFQSLGASPEAVAQRRLFQDLTAQTKRLICDRCDGRVWVAWAGETWALRCKEGFQPDIIGTNLQESRRSGTIMSQQTTDLANIVDPAPALPATMSDQQHMTIAQFKDRQELRQYVIHSMVEGKHYGKAFESAKGLSLLEPGAEYLRAAFNVAWDYDVVVALEDWSKMEFYYEIRAFQLLAPNVRSGGWTGSAWSKEKKFNGMEPTMLHHNVRDRALKRAFVLTIKNITGCSGDFQGSDEEVIPAIPEQAAKPQGNAPHLGEWGNCPQHDIPWVPRETEYGVLISHRQEDAPKGWCRFSDLYAQQFKAVFEEAFGHISQAEANEWLKGNFEGRTWSKLTPQEMLDSIELLRPPASVDPEQAPPPAVDPETGEIQPEGQAGFGGMPPAEQADH